MNPRWLGIFAILAVVAGLSTWLQDTSELTPEKHAILDTEHSIDFFMESYDATVMNEQGKPSHRIISPKLVHFSDTDNTELESPYMLVYRRQGQPWQITSKRGWSAAKNEHILLTGDVVLNRSKSPFNEAMVIETEKLRVHPDDKYAETDTKVVLRGENQRTEANGMRAYLAKGQIQLLDKVKTHYEN